MRSRVENWHARLVAVIARHERLPFGWRTSDCLMFAADAAEAVTGRRFERPVYRTAAEARRVMRNMGAANAGDVIAHFFEEIPPAMAHVGDLATVPAVGGSQAAGLCIGDQVLAKAEQGLVRHPRCVMIRAFAVGHAASFRASSSAALA